MKINFYIISKTIRDFKGSFPEPKLWDKNIHGQILKHWIDEGSGHAKVFRKYEEHFSE